MSSILDAPNSHPASLCIDGITTTFCHTADSETDPWVSVEIASVAEVSYVVILNRMDCCHDRLSPLQIWVGTSVGDYNSATSASCGVDEVSLHVPATTGPFSFRCADSMGNPLAGTFVTIVLPGPSRTLHVAEIEAFSAPAPSLPPQ